MKTPVIIPAYNEERNIRFVLNSLPRDLVEPIVSVNGSVDRTAAIAYNCGARLVESDELGKLPAIQRALRYLGDRALQPLIILDADSAPICPRLWHNRLVGEMNNEASQSVVSGPAWFMPKESSNVAVAAMRSIHRMGGVLRTSRSAMFSGKGGAQHGPNLGLHIKHSDLLEEVLDLEHFWPGDEHAITEVVVNDNGGVYKQLLSPVAMVLTPESVSYPPFTDYLRYGTEQTNDALFQDYIRRAAPGSRPYNRPRQ
jgi:glycosyltransferase involved in cell wall biosynthesis